MEDSILYNGKLYNKNWFMNKIALENFLTNAGHGTVDKSFKEFTKTNKIDYNMVDENGRTFLHYAVMHPNPEFAEILIKEYKLDPNQADKYGNTPIMCFSMYFGGEEKKIHNMMAQTADVLIKNGAIINLQNCDGNTALHMAARNNNQILVPFLLSKGADESKRNKLGQTAKYISNFYEEYEYDNTCCNIERKKGYFQGKVYIRDNYKTELMNSVETGNIELVKQILEQCLEEEKDTNINFQNNKGETALTLAIKNNDLSMVKLLVENGARVDERCIFQYNYDIVDGDEISGFFTPLHITISSDNTNEYIIKYLIEQGANVNGIGFYGATPFYLATYYEKWEIAALLLLNGANVNNCQRNSEYLIKNKIKKFGFLNFLENIVEVCKKEFNISNDRETIGKILDMVDKSFIDFCKNEFGLSSSTTKEEVLECMLQEFKSKKTLKLQSESLSKTEEHMKTEKKQLQNIQDALEAGNQLNSLDIQIMADINYSNLNAKEKLKVTQQELNNIIEQNKQNKNKLHNKTIKEIQTKIDSIKNNTQELGNIIMEPTEKLTKEQNEEFEIKFDNALNYTESNLSNTSLGQRLSNAELKNEELTLENKQLMNENKRLTNEKDELAKKAENLENQLERYKIYLQQAMNFSQNVLNMQQKFFQQQYQLTQQTIAQQNPQLPQYQQNQIQYSQPTQMNYLQTQQRQYQQQSDNFDNAVNMFKQQTNEQNHNQQQTNNQDRFYSKNP